MTPTPGVTTTNNDEPTPEEVEEAISGSDQNWHDFSGACGGCGETTCHEGRCPTSLCNVCPSRIAEGWFDVRRHQDEINTEHYRDLLRDQQ
jgi:hypothetical protein